MGRIGHNFPPPDQLPIPHDVRPGPGWTQQMLEMADHIGPYRTLLIVERFGGQRIYIPADAEKGKCYGPRGTLRDLIGIAAARKLSQIYRREYLVIPTAGAALRRARRAPLLATVRESEMTITEASLRTRSARTYVSHLINNTREGADDDAPRPRAPGRRSSGQPDLFGDLDE